MGHVIISKVELKLIVEKETNPTLSSIYSFAFGTGLRISEITNLKWNEVDLISRIINVKSTEDFTTKSKKERVIPISNVVYDLLTNLNNNSNYVFTKNGGKFNSTYVSKSFKKCVRATELNQKIHFHTLRHSFASCLAQQNVSLIVIKQLLGHESIQTSMIYSHLRTEDLVKAINELN